MSRHLKERDRLIYRSDRDRSNSIQFNSIRVACNCSFSCGLVNKTHTKNNTHSLTILLSLFFSSSTFILFGLQQKIYYLKYNIILNIT